MAGNSSRIVVLSPHCDRDPDCFACFEDVDESFGVHRDDRLVPVAHDGRDVCVVH